MTRLWRSLCVGLLLVWPLVAAAQTEWVTTRVFRVSISTLATRSDGVG